MKITFSVGLYVSTEGNPELGLDAMAAKALEVRDSFDGVSAGHYRAWDNLATAIQNAATEKRASYK